jgi:ABC-2 type transport system ATP-binding protein
MLTPPPNASRRAAAPCLSIGGLCLSYGSRVALDGVDMEVGAGEVLGLLGPNGCGKSSLMRCLTGLRRADRGTLRLDGVALPLGDRRLRRSLGVVFQEPSLDIHLSAEENLWLGAALFGIGRTEARVRARELLNFMDLQARHKDRVRTFSGGMRRRLELARALIHRPRILLLDEPTGGLDPAAYERTWQKLLALRTQQGLTIVFSTHRADEAARCDRLLVLDRGHVVACDTPESLLRRVAGDVVLLEADDPQALATELSAQLDLVATVQRNSAGVQQVMLRREAGHTLIPKLFELVGPGRIHSVAVRRPSLADAFFHLTGHGLLALGTPQDDA